MSVALTEPQVRAEIKTVTRRAGWWLTKRGQRMVVPGDHLQLVRKAMGLRPGEAMVHVRRVRVTSVTREQLNTITPAEVLLEGLAPMTPAEFVEFFCATHKGIRPTSMVTRIEWVYV